MPDVPTEATPGDNELQEPPVTASVSAIVDPPHTDAAPDIVPALTVGLTVTMRVAVAVPQLPEML